VGSSGQEVASHIISHTTRVRRTARTCDKNAGLRRRTRSILNDDLNLKENIRITNNCKYDATVYFEHVDGSSYAGCPEGEDWVYDGRREDNECDRVFGSPCAPDQPSCSVNVKAGDTIDFYTGREGFFTAYGPNLYLGPDLNGIADYATLSSDNTGVGGGAGDIDFDVSCAEFATYGSGDTPPSSSDDDYAYSYPDDTTSYGDVGDIDAGDALDVEDGIIGGIIDGDYRSGGDGSGHASGGARTPSADSRLDPSKPLPLPLPAPGRSPIANGTTIMPSSPSSAACSVATGTVVALSILSSAVAVWV
jgi:hypothetical protein